MYTNRFCIDTLPLTLTFAALHREQAETGLETFRRGLREKLLRGIVHRMEGHTDASQDE